MDALAYIKDPTSICEDTSLAIDHYDQIFHLEVAPPFKLAEFDIMYGQGISKVGEILDIAVEHDIIKKAGSWFSYDDTKLGQGRDAVKALIKDNPELMDELEEKVRAKVNEIEA